VLDAAEETEELITPRLADQVRRHNREHPESRVPLTMMLGIARFDPATPPAAEALVQRASAQRAKTA
jgi:GGDEF domain-containing protein